MEDWQLAINSPLLRAILLNDIKILKSLVDRGADINVTWVDGKPIRHLHYAISQFPICVDAALWLIKNGADVNIKDGRGDTPLHILARLHHSERENGVYLLKCQVAQALIENGAEVEARGTWRVTPLCAAACTINTKLVVMLLSAGADVNTDQCLPPVSILHVLLRAFAKIIEKSTGINQTDVVTNRNLLKGQLGIIRVLLNKGADVNAKDEKGRSLLHVSLLLHGRLDIVELLLEKGADINSMDDLGITPLTVSIIKNQLKTFSYLIEHGASVNKTKPNMVPPIEVGLDFENYDFVKGLIQAGADVNQTIRHGSTPLHVAVTYLNISFLRLLVESGADIHRNDSAGNYAIDQCIFDSNIPSEFVQVFIDFGFDVNRNEYFGMTAFDFVMMRKSFALIKTFWRHGCPLPADLSYEELESREAIYLFKLNKISQFIKESAESAINQQKYRKLLVVQRKFMTGIKQNNTDMVLKALKEGAEPRGCSEDILFPLHYLAKHGYHEVLKILVENGASANVLDQNGDTALQLAAREGHVQTCKLLLQHGACFSKAACELSSRDNLASHQETLGRLFRKIKTLFGFARRGDVSLVKWLVKSGSGDPSMFWSLMNCVDNRGGTLLASALRGGHGDLAARIMRLRLDM